MGEIEGRMQGWEPGRVREVGKVVLYRPWIKTQVTRLQFMKVDAHSPQTTDLKYALLCGYVSIP